ncbi:MAG: threonine--tRNA ligase [Elusimicrobia bacterium HGW-Elusimicrobia-2]|nr:MAG: threonine--tRNA ligase [Elusimicrobia bacterium HGW-Elusimicrobia-2]
MNENKYSLETLRHSAAHIMAYAVQRLYKNVKFAIGPSIENGFYYDFDLDTAIKPDDFKKISGEMQKIIKEKLPFRRYSLKKAEALKFFSEKGQIYKSELINEIKDEEVSLYELGDFTDLCRGPHIENSGELRNFQLLDIAGAYWRGSEKNKMLQRVYGTAFFTKDDLMKYVKFREEAKKRDHRVIGKHLFSIHPESGPGLIHWHPDGAQLLEIIEGFWKKEHLRNGYQLVRTPHVASEELYRISGHLQNYSDMMYSSMDIEGKPYRVRPMNCPGHIKIYSSTLHSYRDLPVRLAELGTVYRFEKSGVLHGLLRVRGFTIDDAHIIVAEDQVMKEIENVFEFALKFLSSFGFKEFKVYISTRPEQKYVGELKDWALAEESLKKAVESKNIEYEMDEGGGAFYGPKIDIKIKDALGRLWQCSTIQFDFNLPDRFSVFYIDEKGEKQTPFMIHRAIFGSIERFVGMLTEQYAANFPLWLAPQQLRIVTISEKNIAAAEAMLEKLADAGIRVALDSRNLSLNKKIRNAIMEHVPYIGIVGDKEAASGKMALRDRKADVGSFSSEELIEKFLVAIDNLQQNKMEIASAPLDNLQV